MNCRIGCAACCIAPSISSPIPGMPDGKPANIRCVQLTPENQCRIFDKPERPAVCISLKPDQEMCGNSPEEAMQRLQDWETLTSP
jgi:Fe-S-cluster containining protein